MNVTHDNKWHEWTSCQMHGHIYEARDKENPYFYTCRDCGDSYTDTDKAKDAVKELLSKPSLTKEEEKEFGIALITVGIANLDMNTIKLGLGGKNK